ncbi:MAG: sulfatase-like hydrolase/transferase [Planctomycetota bacterium]|jgi:arylsulfatase A-like enzyme
MPASLTRIARALCLVILFTASAHAEKPNVILIMADDLGWESIGAYGSNDYQTPHLDRLAADGIRFENCFSTPICTTSRVKIMTGQYNFRNYTHFGYLGPEQKTFGHLMRQNGYATAIAGKWQLNGLYNTLPGHDNNQRPVVAGFDEYCLWQLTQGKGPGERFWHAPIETAGQFITKEQNANKYGPDLLADFICDFIERKKDQPFFVYYPMVLVHDPFVPTPVSIGDVHPSKMDNKTPKNAAAMKDNFGAMINYMDKIIGRIVKKVEDEGLADNTIIMFTADNGTNVRITSKWKGRDIQGGKGGMKDMGTHVPFIAYWKGHTPRGAVFEDLIDFTDFYATLAETAGHKLGADDPFDGRSFFPRLMNQTGNPRDWVLCHYQPYWNKTPGQFARTAEFKLYRNGGFFNVPLDMEEANDLGSGAQTERASAAYRRLKAILDNAPPAPTGKGDRNTEERPTYADWPLIDLAD